MTGLPRPTARVAVLFQALDPPIIEGVRKPRKPTGYADSGADIAFALSERGVDVITRVAEPDPTRDLDWVFPDTPDGIDLAIAEGADTLWANTILFHGHPIEAVLDRVDVVGQHPAFVHEFDDKWYTNELMRAHGLPVTPAILVAERRSADATALDDVDATLLGDCGIGLPAILKPLRGRGSQGVVKVADVADLRSIARSLIGDTIEVEGRPFPRYGSRLILERFLDGVEITVTVMPPGSYTIDGADHVYEEHWALPPIERSGQRDGVIPYSGVVPVEQNSRVMTERSDALDDIVVACSRAGRLLGARAPIRIDCRQTADGPYLMFDVNIKPNITAAGRPGRSGQDSLPCMAARAVGWSYGDLLAYMLAGAWTEAGGRTSTS